VTVARVLRLANQPEVKLGGGVGERAGDRMYGWPYVVGSGYGVFLFKLLEKMLASERQEPRV
jgi:hypothetical protein